MNQALSWPWRSTGVGHSPATLGTETAGAVSRQTGKRHARIAEWMAPVAHAGCADVAATGAMILRGPIAGATLVRDIALTSEIDDSGSYVVSDGIFHVYGCGKTEGDALADYRQALAEYLSIVAGGDRPEDRSLRAVLRT